MGVTGSSAGFILPSIDSEEILGTDARRNLRAPDVSFIRANRLKTTKRDFFE